MAAAKLKIAGAWSGLLEVDLDSYTLSMLRSEIAHRSSTTSSSSIERRRINLICGGKVLKDCDDDRTLSQLGLKNNSKLLATAVCADGVKVVNDQAEQAAAEAERSAKLTRLKAAAAALAERHAGGSVPVEDFDMEITDQSGQKVQFGSESDQRGLMMGLMLHSRAKGLIKQQKYKDALDVLSMAEEAFSLCDPKHIELVDNVPILQLDIVWCHFMLRDISLLSVAGACLAKARKGFERAHGKDSTRFRLLQAGRHAELAIYMRLELLEGVVAYHSGNFEESRKALNSAQSKYVQLQIPDEALSLLMNMGYKEKAAKRALRMTGQDIQSAVDFLVEERAQKARRYEEDIQRQNEIMEQKKYGTTPQNKAVDIQSLNELVSIGFERYLAAEALRLNENDMQKALDLLTDPDGNCNLQRQIDSRRPSKFPRLSAAGIEGSSLGQGIPAETRDGVLGQLDGSVLGSNTEQADINSVQDGLLEGGSDGAAAAESPVHERDVAMEKELAKEGDVFADYDLEVAKEGESIAEYLSLLDSTANVSNGSL